MAHLARPWPGSPAETQPFGPTTYTGEPPGFVWDDGSVTYFTVGGTRHDHVHCGIDFALNSGTPLVAPADGAVEFAGTDNTGFGLCLKIAHTALGIGTLYGHLQDILVAQGATVRAGQLIAHTNNTGNSSGPHLHFTVYRLSDRHYIDPAPFLAGPAPRPPQPPNRYYPVAFAVTADSDGHPINTFAGPSNAAHCTGAIPAGSKVSCVGWMFGDAHYDDAAHQWDCRWYLTDSFQWAASARVQGNPPNSSPQ